MYNQDILYAVEDKFKTDWNATEIHFEGASAEPTGDEWIHLRVMPMTHEQIGYGSCVEATHMIYVTCYASNKVRCAILADMVDAFISFQKLGDFTTGVTSPVNQGSPAEKLYFYRVRTPIKS